jgi:hypothetical protein
MSNNYWNQPPENNDGNNHNGSSRSGSMVRNYSDQTMQAPPQYSPLTNQPPKDRLRLSIHHAAVSTPQQQECPHHRHGQALIFGNVAKQYAAGQAR